MTFDNLIIVKGGSYSDVKKALKQWIFEYHKDLNDDFKFKVFKNGRGNHVIQADDRLDNCRFNYLINYLQYPIDIEYKVSVIGFTVANDPEIYNQELLGKRIQVYIPEDDTEYDVVYIVSEYNQVYKVDFGGKTTKLDYKGEYQNISPDLNLLADPEVVFTEIKEIKEQEKGESIKSIEKRFKIISLIALTFGALSSITIFLNPKLFVDLNFFLSIAIGAWLFGDYKLLQIDKFYLYSFLLATGLFLYGLLIKNYIFPNSADYVKIGFLYPITILVIQKPARLLFKLLLKREPVIDKPPPTFWDGVYTIILFIAFAILPLIFLK
jgi:hypothetical protein